MRKIHLFLACFWVVFSAMAEDIHVNITNPNTWTASELSSYNGKTVIFDNAMYIVQNYNNSYYVSPRRIFTPTHVADPSVANCDYYTNLNDDGRIYISSISNYHRTGEKIYNLKAKVYSSSLQYIDGTWSGNTRENLRANLPDVDTKGTHTILVCAMNLEYYLTDLTNVPSYNTQGPNSAAEHARQRAKVSKALARINADIYGLVEIQKGDGALREIAEDLTKNTGRPFTYISEGDAADGTFTKSGYVYCSSVVEPASAIQYIDAVVPDRKKMVVFREILSRERFIFSLNHFKAKSGSGSGGDADQNDCQGQFNASRTKEAQAVLTKYNKFKGGDIDEEDILVMGDLNAYAKEDPIKVFTDAEFIDLYPCNGRTPYDNYSYTYHSVAGYLDHALCNSTMYNQITGMAAYHINSDELDSYTYKESKTDTSMFRSSDHDPVLVGIKLKAKPTTEVGLNSIEVYYTESDIIVTNAYKNVWKSYYRIYSLDGHLMEQQNITSKEQHFSRPTHSGVYLVAIYYYDLYHNGSVKHFKIIVP